MNEEKILNAIGLVGDDLIIRADGPIPAAGLGKSWLRWGALAACVCLLIGAARLVLPAISGAKSAAPAAAEAPAAMMDMAAMEESAPALTEEAPAEEALAEPKAEPEEADDFRKEPQGTEKAEADGGANSVIREPITVMGRYYEQILSTDPDYTPAELTEEALEFYIERSNGDRVYVLTWTETPAGLESWPYTIAVFRDGSVPVQYRYIGEQVYYDGLPESMRIGTANLKRVGVDDPLTFFHEDFPEESLGKPWQVLADGSRLYVVGERLSDLVFTHAELTRALNETDLISVDDALAVLFADDDQAAAYLLIGPSIVCYGQCYTEVPADDPILSVFSAEAEQQADATQPESPWVNPWCILSDGSRVDVLSKSAAVVEGDMVFPEYVIRNFDYGHSVVYRFTES